MHDFDHLRRLLTRRAFLNRAGGGLGALAFAGLVDPAFGGDDTKKGDRWPGVIQKLHVPAKAKRVIWLYMAGGMSHLETWDPKPKLAEMHGKPMPESVTKGQQIAQLQGAKLNCFGPQHPFKKWGKSGIEFSSIWPKLGAACADDLCLVRSLH